jgi:hypothetical protein
MRCGHGRDWRRKASGDAFATLCTAALLAICRNWDSTTLKPCSVMPIRVTA